MTDILIHKSSAYIKEDKDYYCSDIRDKHGMIKPDDNLLGLKLKQLSLLSGKSNN